MKKITFPLRFSIPGVLFLSGSLFGWFSFHREVAISYQRAEERASHEARFAANQISGLLQYLYRQGNNEAAELVLSQLGAYTDIELAVMCDENNKILLATRYEMRNQALANTSLAKDLPILEKTRDTLLPQVVFNRERKGLKVIYTVELPPKNGQFISSKIGLLIIDYDIAKRKKEAFADATKRSLEGVSVLMILSVGIWLFFHKALTLRVNQLVIAAKNLAYGDLSIRTQLQGNDELAEISQAFDQMAERIQFDTEALQLSQISLAHAHADTIAKAEQLRLALENLQKTQAQLIQTEKMSSLGQMVAGIAHEINNPVSFIYGNIAHTSEYIEHLIKLIKTYQKNYPQPPDEISSLIYKIELDFLIEDLPKMLNSMELGAERITDIVLSLRNFSRLDEAEMKAVNIHDGIESTLLILRNRLKNNSLRSSINVVKKYGNLPLIQCYPGQLNQVFMNIIGNAIDALEVDEKTSELPGDSYPIPTITIETLQIDTHYITIKIADNGSGIPSEIQTEIFNPFFTTKPVGKGTGLGLSISYQIVVEKHGGRIYCDSQYIDGTCFYIDIPVSQVVSR